MAQLLVSLLVSLTGWKHLNLYLCHDQGDGPILASVLCSLPKAPSTSKERSALPGLGEPLPPPDPPKLTEGQQFFGRLCSLSVDCQGATEDPPRRSLGSWSLLLYTLRLTYHRLALSPFWMGDIQHLSNRIPSHLESVNLC